MVVVEAGDAVHSLYRAGTKTPVGGEAEAGVLGVLGVGPEWSLAVERRCRVTVGGLGSTGSLRTSGQA